MHRNPRRAKIARSLRLEAERLTIPSLSFTIHNAEFLIEMAIPPANGGIANLSEVIRAAIERACADVKDTFKAVSQRFNVDIAATVVPLPAKPDQTTPTVIAIRGNALHAVDLPAWNGDLAFRVASDVGFRLAFVRNHALSRCGAH